MIKLTAIGQLIRTPKLTITKKGKKMCMSMIRCDATSFNDKQQLSINYSLIGFNEMAETLNKYSIDDQLAITGKLTLNEWVKNSKQYSNHQLEITDISTDVLHGKAA